MQCEEREQREGESRGESFLLPCRGHLSQVRLSLPVNHRVETVLPPLRAEDAPCGSLCDSLCDSLSGHWVYGWPQAWSVLNVHGRSAWNPPLPSAPVGVSELQPVSPRKYRTVCVWQTIVPKRSRQFPYNSLTWELLLELPLEGGRGRGAAGSAGCLGRRCCRWAQPTSGHFSRKGNCPAVCYLGR